MQVALTHTKGDFEISPQLVPFIEKAHEVIKEFSQAEWAKSPTSFDYQFAHLWVCRDLYSLAISPKDNAEINRYGHLIPIASIIEADSDRLLKEYKD